jgi:hypothetical protein
LLALAFLAFDEWLMPCPSVDLKVPGSGSAALPLAALFGKFS